LQTDNLIWNIIPDKTNGNIWNIFLQNEFKLIPDVFHVTAGAKAEYHYFTDFEFQPSIRFAYYPSDNQTIWGSISRAARTPTRAERTISFIAASTGGGFVRVVGNPEYESEDLNAFELGYRNKAFNNLSIDTSLFFNEYKDLRTLEPGTTNFPSTGTAANVVISNLGYGEAYGLEIEAKYTPYKNWLLIANYSLVELDFHLDENSNDTTLDGEEDQTPEQQINLLSRYNFTKNLELDLNLSFVDELPDYDIDEQIRFDMRLGWKPIENMSLSLVGQNMFGSSSVEFDPFLFGSKSEVDKSYYLKMEVKF